MSILGRHARRRDQEDATGTDRQSQEGQVVEPVAEPTGDGHSGTGVTAGDKHADTTQGPARTRSREPRGSGAQAARRGDYSSGEYVPAEPGHSGDRPAEVWGARARIVLLPTAAPSILGLFGLMGATVMVGAWFAGWYGTPASPLVLFPFVAAFGGIAQLAAGLFAYRARDGLASAVHGLWGSFWIAFGVLQFLILLGLEPATRLGVSNTAFAWWFIVLCAITAMTALAAPARGLAMFTVLVLLAVASGFTAVGFYGGFGLSITVAGYLFVAAAAAAWYTASAMMFKESYGRVILPLGEWRAAAHNVPGAIAGTPIQYEAGMPGARIGQ